MTPALAWVALLACRPGPSGPSDPPGAPDLVVISVDTLRSDRLGFMGHEAAHTPAFDALAASGFVFREATTPLPRTTPALASLQTGLRPTRHGSREVGEAVTAEVRLASWLGDAGWQAVGLSATPVAGPEQHLDRGFRVFEVMPDGPAPDLTGRALELVGGLGGDAPAYLWVHYADPHFPYLPHPSGPVQPEAPACRRASERAAAGKLQRVELFADRGGRARAMLEECRALYDAEIAVVDQAVGQLLDGLRHLRGDRARLVVLTADHGENHGEDGLYYEHGPSVHDADVLVPLVLAGPGVPRGADDGVARLEDVAPTVLELLGLPVPDDLDGRSLATRIRGDRGAGPTVAPIEAGSALQVRLFGWPVSGREKHWCLNDGPLSWCTWAATDAAPARSGLFDHERDPGLTRDLSAERPDDARRLAAAAAAVRPERTRHRRIRTADRWLVAAPGAAGWMVTTSEGGPPRDGDPLLEALASLEAEIRAADAGAEPPPVGDTEEALRALGYVE